MTDCETCLGSYPCNCLPDTTTGLDLRDQMVREMANRNHEPMEQWTAGGQLIHVCCRTCGQPWPCRTRRALISTVQG